MDLKITDNATTNWSGRWSILVALLAALTYGLGCWLFGENFPFSRYELYSDSAKRESSAVIVFMVDGIPADVWDYHRFSGLSPESFLPDHISSGLEWVSHEMARWVAEHQESGASGPVQVSIGYRLFSVDDEHSLQEELLVLQHGQAWRRRAWKQPESY